MIMSNDAYIRLRLKGFTPRSIEILKFLLKSKGKFVAAEQIINEVWGAECNLHPSNLKVQMYYLRKSILNARMPCRIETLYGDGYRALPLQEGQ